MPRTKKETPVHVTEESFGFEGKAIPEEYLETNGELEDKIFPLDLDLGREDFNRIVSKINEVIAFINK